MKLSDRPVTETLVVAAALVIVPGIMLLLGIFGTSSSWSDARLEAVRELDAAEDELSNAQLNHAKFMLSGSPQLLRAFNDAAERTNEHLSKLGKDPDPQLSAQMQVLQPKIRKALEEMRASALIRQNQGMERASTLITSNLDARETRQYNRQMLSLADLQTSLLELKLRGISGTLDSVRWTAIGGAIIYLIAYLSLARMFQPALRAAEEQNKQLASEVDLLKQQMDRMSIVDPITEVLSSRGLERVLAVEENRTIRAGGNLIIALINIDDFKNVNATVGHASGNVILREVAQRIRSVLRPSDHVGRVTGDEFLILLIDTQIAFAMRVAERIRVALADAAVRSGVDAVNLTVSIGVAVLPRDVENLQEVIQIGRSGVQRAKLGGKNRVSLAREVASLTDNDPKQQTEGTIVQMLREGNCLRTNFQPIVNLATEKITGYEIFTRGPAGAFESPMEFFRVCTENNILTVVDLHCIKLAIATVSDIDSQYRFHINIFPSTLLDTKVDTLLALFSPLPNRHGKFCIEISEQQFIGDPSYLRDHVNALREAGILVAIDDVGFGRSSLESLILLEPDLVKVDRKYVTGVSREPAKARLLKRVVNVAKSLGAEIVAEGIEVKDDLPVLKEIGVHYGQGFYFGKPQEFLPSKSTTSSASERR